MSGDATFMLSLKIKNDFHGCTLCIFFFSVGWFLFVLFLFCVVF